MSLETVRDGTVAYQADFDEARVLPGVPDDAVSLLTGTIRFKRWPDSPSPTCPMNTGPVVPPDSLPADRQHAPVARAAAPSAPAGGRTSVTNS